MRLHCVIRFAALPLALAALASSATAALASPATDAQGSSTVQQRPAEGQALPGVVDQFRDAAGRGTHGAPAVTVVRVTEPATATDGGIDWCDAGIGAASLIGLILLGVAVATMIRHRRSETTATS
jgi:hypothetical protein